MTESPDRRDDEGHDQGDKTDRILQHEIQHRPKRRNEPGQKRSGERGESGDVSGRVSRGHNGRKHYHVNRHFLTSFPSTRTTERAQQPFEIREDKDNS